MAVFAAWNVELFEIATHVGPVIGAAEQGIGFVGAEVAHGVVAKTVEGFAELRNARHAEAVPNEEEAVAHRDTGERPIVEGASLKRKEGVGAVSRKRAKKA